VEEEEEEENLVLKQRLSARRRTRWNGGVICPLMCRCFVEGKRDWG
jgi:hypothetical protein